MVLGPPPIFIDCSVYIPTPGTRPLNSECFHLTPIHTILDESFGKNLDCAARLLGTGFEGQFFFAKKRTLGNRLISCSLMTAFGQKRTSSIVMVEQRTENPRVDGSIPSRVTGVQNHCIFTLTSFLPLGLFRPCSRSEKRTQTTSELTCYFLLRPLLHVC